MTAKQMWRKTNLQNFKENKNPKLTVILVGILKNLLSWKCKRIKTIAMAENRTRINCLEGSYADHYTTIASYYNKEKLMFLST